MNITCYNPQDKGGLFPAEYKREELCNDRKHDTAPLDPNHTHFVLVDNGTENTYGTEIEFRAALEEHISQTKVIEKGKLGWNSEGYSHQYHLLTGTALQM